MNLLKKILKKNLSLLWKILGQFKLYSMKYNSFKKLQIKFLFLNQKNNFLKKIKEILKKSPYTEKLMTILKNALGNYNLFRFGLNGAVSFNGDMVLKKMVNKMLKFFNITSFIETGTHLGSTSLKLAKLYSNLQVYSCEIEKSYFKIVKEVSKNLNNFHIENVSSEKFLIKLFKNNKNDNPLIFLDAHWYDYFPLQDEIKVISRELNKCIIIIHDFEVPNNSECAFYIYKGTSNRPRSCNLSLIKNKFDNKKEYTILFPKSNNTKKIGSSPLSRLVGYVIIFQNLNDLFYKFKNDNFVQSNFFKYKS